jgi:hypothetical protein
MDEAPKDELGALKARLAELEEIARMQARIAELETQLLAPRTATAPADSTEPNEIETHRAELKALGVKVDQRWGVERLRDELERATAAE